MAHVASFSVSGLNGRRTPVEETLNRHVNVFFGANGSGKTSVLKIIDSALNANASTVFKTSFDGARVDVQSVKYKKTYVMSYSKSTDRQKPHVAQTADTQPGTGRSTRRRGGEASPRYWKWEPEAPEGIYAWSHVYLPTSRLYLQRRFMEATQYLTENDELLEDRVGTGEERLDLGFAHALQSLWRGKFSETLGRVRTIQQNALQSIFLSVLKAEDVRDQEGDQANGEKSGMNAGKAFDRMSSFLERQSDRRTRDALGSAQVFASRFEADPRFRQIVTQIDLVEAKIEAEMRPLQQLSTLVARLFSNGKLLSFDGPSIIVATRENNVIGLEALSSGEKHLIRIFLAAIEAEENALIIDEPELSLHIDWQRDLIKNIRILNPNCQLIVATHSPEIMADVPDNEIFRI